MKSIRGVLSLISMFLIPALSACNLPVAKSSVPSGPDPQTLALTMVAQTMQARAAAYTATPAATATLSSPQVTVSVATNCRTGPDANYAFVMLFQPGMSAPIVGKYSPANYWIISMPNGGTCWLWGSYAIVQGDVSRLTEVAPPQLVMAPQPTAVPAQQGNNNSGNSGAGSNPLVPIGPLTIVTQPVFALIVPNMPTSFNSLSFCNYIGTPPKLKSRTDTLNWSAVTNIDGYYIFVNGSQTFKVSKATVGYQVPAAISLTATSYGIASFVGSQSSKIRTTIPKGCK